MKSQALLAMDIRKKLVVDIDGRAGYKASSNLVAELWLLRDWHRALNEPSFKIAIIIRDAWRCGLSILLKGFVMITGTVKWFNSTKGFGFIQPDNGDADAFVHISAVERAGMRELVEGQKVSFELERDKKSGKMSACNLQAA